MSAPTIVLQLEYIANSIESATGCKVTGGDVDEVRAAIVFDVRPAQTALDTQDSVERLIQMQDRPGKLVYTLSRHGNGYRLYIQSRTYRIANATPEFTAHYIARRLLP